MTEPSTPCAASAPMAITMGDASGVGPEIVLRRAHEGAFADGDVVIFGDASIMLAGAQLLDIGVEIAILESAAESRPGSLNMVDLGCLAATDHRPGALDASAGAAALAYVAAATDAALAGEVAGVVTMPMNKEATQLTEPSFVGHTEFIAERCGSTSITMMLTAGSVAVTHVSTHCSLRDAIDRVRHDRILEVIRLTNDSISRFIPEPRIAVCGLNPHAGEHGLFGSEDADHIEPAIASARAEGMDASGPHPADTVFHQAIHRDRYDAIVVMYHDQGHAPMKLLAFDSGVNVTLGLPIIRTSVDHGTAFDIAWSGVASTDSLDHALAYAHKLAGR
jgi:4-hydroxythreonine-4-phosphate dehydrogenase